MNANGKTGGILEAIKAILSSPVGGWALAVGVVAYMGWITIEDRKALYDDVKHLRDVVMPTITQGPKVAYENQKLIEQIKQMNEANHALLLEIRTNQVPKEDKSELGEILRLLKEKQAPPYE